jgi:hypothetical protein
MRSIPPQLSPSCLHSCCLQADQAAQLGVVGQVRRQAAVVQPGELLEDQAGQELGLGELLGAGLMSMFRQRLAGGLVGDLQHPALGFTRSHISYYEALLMKVHRFSTKQGMVISTLLSK